MIESEPTIFSQDYLFTILWIGNTFLALLHDLLLDQRARAYCDSHWRTAIIEGRGIILRGRQWHRHDCRTNGAAAVVNTLPIFRARVIPQGILYPSPVTPPHKERLKMQGTMIMSASVATPPISDLPHSDFTSREFSSPWLINQTPSNHTFQLQRQKPPPNTFMMTGDYCGVLSYDLERLIAQKWLKRSAASNVGRSL